MCCELTYSDGDGHVVVEKLRQFAMVLVNGVVPLEFALLYELSGDDGGECLADTGNAHHCISRARYALFDIR